MRASRVTRLGLSAVLAVAGLVSIVAPAAPATAGCAGNSHRYTWGFVYGADNRDVNVSLGYDVVDSAGRPINIDPRYSDYGCLKDGNHGGYSIYPVELNHYVRFDGVPQHSLMSNGAYTTRTWAVTNLPSNAAGIWVEVYSRGYTGSPCTTCMNPGNTTKYGFANKHFVPIGAKGVRVVLPMRCGAYGGNAGYIGGAVRTASGASYKLSKIYAWTTSSWNAAPSVQGWGSGTTATGSYQIAALASGQRYTVWAYRQDGSVVKKYNVPVYPCHTTTLNVGV